MKVTVDNQIVRIFNHNGAEIVKNLFISDLNNQINFRWPSLLEYLELGSLLSNVSVFDQTQPIFTACVSTLCANEEKEVLCYVYDRLFAENLTQIKALPQINASFLLNAIKEQQQKPSFLEVEKVLSLALSTYETALLEKPSETIHNLILYLAWDRMCVCMARLFDYPATNPKFIKGIGFLKECLLESYQHIAQKGQTSPGIYRMLESLVYYQMREENLPKHTEAEWKVLSQSFPVLKPQDEILDLFYIDDAIFPEGKLKTEGENLDYHLTLDSPDSVNSRLALAQYMMDKIKGDDPHWNYVLRPKKIAYLNL